jgi:hypothetical protein
MAGFETWYLVFFALLTTGLGAYAALCLRRIEPSSRRALAWALWLLALALWILVVRRLLVPRGYRSLDAGLMWVSAVPALAGAIVLFIEVASRPTKAAAQSEALRPWRSVARTHRTLAMVYGAVILCVIILEQLPIPWLDAHFGLAAYLLGPSCFQVIGPGALAVLVPTAVPMLWLLKRPAVAYRVLASRCSTVLPPVAAAALSALMHTPEWLQVNRLLARGQIWPVDVHSAHVFLVVTAAALAVTFALYWHLLCLIVPWEVVRRYRQAADEQQSGPPPDGGQ